MKAVIMAGGEGRRLRPITGESPKPLVPLLGKPIMEHIIELLKKQGFEDICAAVKYKAEDIMTAFGDGSSLGVRLQYRHEGRPLGTAGSVKNCSDFYGSEDFLVISGDAACDFELKDLMETHKSRGAAVTMALYRHESPLSYGLTVTDEDDRIRAFVEKPPWERVVSDLVNTGIYIISPHVMELVPQGKSFDFAKDLFPLLLERGETMLGVPMEGYWCDVGEPLSYYRCCADALTGRLKIELPESFRPVQREEKESPVKEQGAYLECPCRSRAELMTWLSRAVLELDADYSDGISICAGAVHVSPLSSRSAVAIRANPAQGEFARRLALSLKDLAEALG